jgi:hypothetical protein
LALVLDGCDDALGIPIEAGRESLLEYVLLTSALLGASKDLFVHEEFLRKLLGREVSELGRSEESRFGSGTIGVHLSNDGEVLLEDFETGSFLIGRLVRLRVLILPKLVSAAQQRCQS